MAQPPGKAIWQCLLKQKSLLPRTRVHEEVHSHTVYGKETETLKCPPAGGGTKRGTNIQWDTDQQEKRMNDSYTWAWLDVRNRISG